MPYILFQVHHRIMHLPLYFYLILSSDNKIPEVQILVKLYLYLNFCVQFSDFIKSYNVLITKRISHPILYSPLYSISLPILYSSLYNINDNIKGRRNTNSTDHMIYIINLRHLTYHVTGDMNHKLITLVLMFLCIKTLSQNSWAKTQTLYMPNCSSVTLQFIISLLISDSFRINNMISDLGLPVRFLCYKGTTYKTK